MRLFVGIALPEMVRERLASLRYGIPGARWVEPANLHITLRFIGEVGRTEAEDVDAELAAVHAPAFALTVVGVGFFDKADRVHTLWAGIERCDALAHLYDKIESAVVRCGHEPERRKFTPHVTLARLKNTPNGRLGPMLESWSTFQAGSFPVEAFTLFESFPGRDGAHYEHLADYPLNAE
jgi:2'-5' RNA ligase